MYRQTVKFSDQRRTMYKGEGTICGEVPKGCRRFMIRGLF